MADSMLFGAGECPKCKSENLDYQGFEMQDDGGYYPYTCKECEFEGREYYNLDFVGHYTEDGEKVETATPNNK